MTKSEKIAKLEAEVAFLKSAYEEAEWQLELLKGEGPLLDEIFQLIKNGNRTTDELITFLEGG